MRPALLDPLFAPVTTLDGVGERIADLIEKLVAADATGRRARVVDLLFLLPHSVIDRRHRTQIAQAPEGRIVTLEVQIDRHQPPPRGRPNIPYRVLAHDPSGQISLTFFRGQSSWLERSLPIGERVIVSGRMDWFNGRASMVHPDHLARASDAADMPLVEPVYPLTAGLSARVLRRTVSQALQRLPELAEWQDEAVVQRQRFPSFAHALRQLHEPRDPDQLSDRSEAWRRLAYDEFLSGQVALALVRAHTRRLPGRPLVAPGALVARLRAQLPYDLTDSQERAFSEIRADLACGERMLRLLQGDVGSGKTVVALLAVAQAVEAGGQAALMAPTEVLARQHFASIAPLAEHAGLRVAILTGREKGRQRAETLAGLADGSIHLVIGTHALFQEEVQFRDLALAVIDEQHRFGVHQRLAMTAKGAAPDMLVMTATPIPRTLVLTAFGDMDVSRLLEKPAGRQPIRTVTLPLDRLDDVVERLQEAIERGRKAYWICPLVDESEDVAAMSAGQRLKMLQSVFGGKVGLVHGQMKGPDKDEAMRAFKDGEIRLLVATTVIEVGVDVPDATIMIIEHAERFGLSQLHQLRGRVGRGREASSCLLLYKSPLGQVARQRLSVMRETDDGFVIAEEDLRLRGEGELLGTRQSGTPGFRIARIEAHADLLETARDDARLLLQRDPELQSPRGQALRLLLYLFGRDDAIRLLRAG